MRDNISKKQIIADEKKSEDVKDKWKNAMDWIKINRKDSNPIQTAAKIIHRKKKASDNRRAFEEHEGKSRKHKSLQVRGNEDKTDYANVQELQGWRYKHLSYPFAHVKMFPDNDQEVEEEKLHLEVPKVENDEWPEEEDYAVSKEKIDE